MDGATCCRCGVVWAQPAVRCAECGSSEVVPTPFPGSGTVRAFALVHSTARTPSPWGLAQVETDEGVLLIGPADTTLRIGDRADVVTVDNGVPVFGTAGRER